MTRNREKIKNEQPCPDTQQTRVYQRSAHLPPQLRRAASLHILNPRVSIAALRNDWWHNLMITRQAQRGREMLHNLRERFLRSNRTPCQRPPESIAAQKQFPPGHVGKSIAIQNAFHRNHSNLSL